MASKPNVTPRWYEFHCTANGMGAGSVFRVYGCWGNNDLIMGHGMPMTPAQADTLFDKGIRCPFCRSIAAFQGDYPYNPRQPIAAGGK